MDSLTRVSKSYLDFKKKYQGRITGVPTIDDVVDVYLKNKDFVDFSNHEEGGYAFLVDMEKDYNPPMGGWYDGIYYFDEEELAKNFPKGYITMPPVDNNNFILFESEESRKYSYYQDQCKLWLNVKLENCYDIALELANFMDKNHEIMSIDGSEAKTCYKISTCLKRNDAVTVYTNYNEIDSIIDFLNNLKQRRPKLFETDRKANPLISKIDDFISYADITHFMSCPSLVAENLQYVDKFKSEIEKYPITEQHAFVKCLILKRILKRTDWGFYQNDCTLNTDNFCSTRLNDVPYSILSSQEGEAQREKLANEVEELQKEFLKSNEIEL